MCVCAGFPTCVPKMSGGGSSKFDDGGFESNMGGA